LILWRGQQNCEKKRNQGPATLVSILRRDGGKRLVCLVRRKSLHVNPLGEKKINSFRKKKWRVANSIPHRRAEEEKKGKGSSQMLG